MLSDTPERFAALETVVVVDAHPGDHRELLASQPRNTADAAVGLHTGHLGREPTTARFQELLHVFAVGHKSTVRARIGAAGGTGVTRNTSNYLGSGRAGWLVLAPRHPTASTPRTRMTDTLTLAATGERSSRARWLALIFIATAQLMVVFDASIMNIALPQAQDRSRVR